MKDKLQIELPKVVPEPGMNLWCSLDGHCWMFQDRCMNSLSWVCHGFDFLFPLIYYMRKLIYPVKLLKPAKSTQYILDSAG